MRLMTLRCCIDSWNPPSRLRARQRAGLTCILSLASHHDAVDADSERLQAGRWMARSFLLC